MSSQKKLTEDILFSYDIKDNIEYTNISLKECINDVVPIGVFMQIKKRPDPIYKVLGPAIVKSWNKGFFEVIGFSNSGKI